MKRFIALFIIFVTALSVFTLPISAENKNPTELVLFENGKYKVEFISIDENKKSFFESISLTSLITDALTNSQDLYDINFFINLFTSHTGVPYEEPFIDNSEKIYLFTAETSTEYSNKITCLIHESGVKFLFFGYDSIEGQAEFFSNFEKKLKEMPTDKIVIDQSFFTVEHIKSPEAEKENAELNFFQKAGKLITGFFNLFSFFERVGDNRDVLTNGGFAYIENNSRLNTMISAIYQVLFPIGFIIMLICWGFGVAKSTISSSLDLKDKNSIIHSIISLILGIGVMSLAPQILTVLTGISQWLCSTVASVSIFSWENWEIITDCDITELMLGTVSNAEALFLVLVIIEFVFMINILWIALLQCVSPIFVGFMANPSTRKISFNFIREYAKALLLPVVTLVYYKLVSQLLYDLDPTTPGAVAGISIGLIGAIILGISTVSIAGKKLDKLIN